MTEPRTHKGQRPDHLQAQMRELAGAKDQLDDAITRLGPSVKDDLDAPLQRLDAAFAALGL